MSVLFRLNIALFISDIHVLQGSTVVRLGPELIVVFMRHEEDNGTAQLVCFNQY